MKARTSFFVASNLHGRETEATFGNLETLLHEAGKPHGITITNCTQRRGKQHIVFQHKRNDRRSEMEAHAELIGKRLTVTILGGQSDETGALDALERTFTHLFTEKKKKIGVTKGQHQEELTAAEANG